ncbi:MAG: hypothetical protein JRI28_05130 [Deltaproteobacteria bacterium]|nr:hypothetical protein [Deltaproteobacteria bacterium]
MTMTRRILALIFALSIVVSIAACSRPLQNSGKAVPDGGLVAASYQIADTLENNLKYEITPDDPLIVASFVNINDLEDSSTFGRIVAEQVSSRFAQKGYKIIEMKLRQNSVFMDKGKGEFLLSRDLHEVIKKHNASAVIVGTYGQGNKRLYISSRIVRPLDGTVISSCDVGILMNLKTQTILLRDN